MEIKTLRRSPRFCTLTAPPGQEQFPPTRRSLRFLQKNDISAPTLPEVRRSHSAIRQVHSSHACVRPLQNVSLKTPKSVLANTTNKSSKSGVVSSKNEGSNTGSKKSAAFENGFEGIRIPRRSPRLSCAPKIENALEGRYAKVSNGSSITSGARSSDLSSPSPGVRRSPRLNNGVGEHQSTGKSRMFSCQQDALERCGRDRGKKSSGSDKKMGLLHVKNIDTSVSSSGKNVAEGERRKGNSADPEANVAKSGGTQVVDGEMNKKSVARRKRKREEDVVGIRQGWTKEQEAALHRAYYAAKPTPKFWKKVSKLVFPAS